MIFMVKANEVSSRKNSALLEGTDGVDNISVHGNYQTVTALGSSDTIQIYSGRMIWFMRATAKI